MFYQNKKNAITNEYDLYYWYDYTFLVIYLFSNTTIRNVTKK